MVVVQENTTTTHADNLYDLTSFFFVVQYFNLGTEEIEEKYNESNYHYRLDANQQLAQIANGV